MCAYYNLCWHFFISESVPIKRDPVVHGNHHLQTHRFCWRTLRIHGANSAAKMAPRGVRLVNKRVVSCIKDLNPVSISMPTPMFAPILDLCLYLHLSLSLCLYLHRYLYLISSSKYINVCVCICIYGEMVCTFICVYIYLPMFAFWSYVSFSIRVLISVSIPICVLCFRLYLSLCLYRISLCACMYLFPYLHPCLHLYLHLSLCLHLSLY